MASDSGDPRRRGLAVVLLLLFASGWAANHFTAMIPVLAELERFGPGTLDAAFGVYALGLLPGLLGGGGLSDRVGRSPLVLSGAVVAGLGNVSILLWHVEPWLFVGRLVVGLGVGLVVSAGTAWAADLGGKRATTLAGVFLTAGFGLGPLVSGLLAEFLPGSAAFAVPFVLTAALSLLSAGIGIATRGAPPPPFFDDPSTMSLPVDPSRRSIAVALSASLPMALWVFSTASTAMVVLAARMEGEYHGPWLPGVSAAAALGSGLLIQVVARRAGWGAYAGVAGAVLAALGFVLAAVAGETPTLPVFLACSVVMGCAYGLCLREGLVDVEFLAPADRRGTAIGLFYVAAYLGFGLPVLLQAVAPRVGVVVPMVVLAAIAVTAAVIRSLHIRVTDHLTR